MGGVYGCRVLECGWGIHSFIHKCHVHNMYNPSINNCIHTGFHLENLSKGYRSVHIGKQIPREGKTLSPPPPPHAALAYLQTKVVYTFTSIGRCLY